MLFDQDVLLMPVPSKDTVVCFPDDGGQCRTGSWHRRLNAEQLCEDLAMLPALVTATLQQDHPSLVGSSESDLPVTCLLSKGHGKPGHEHYHRVSVSRLIL